MAGLELLETARETGGIDAVLTIALAAMLQWVKASVLTRLGQIEALCKGMKETQEEHGKAIKEHDEKLRELERAPARARGRS